jgi:voltage-gated potassium channel
MRAMARLNLVERTFEKFLSAQLSVRRAMTVIVTATVVSVIIGGVLIWLLDRKEFPDLGTGLWWAVQTVTTVGYGDVTPADPVGRLIGTVIMLEGIAFIAIVTAAITSSFVERARRQADAAAGKTSPEQYQAKLAEISDRLERIERALEAR